MFSLDDEDTDQLEINSFVSRLDMSRNEYSVNCESEKKILENKSEIYRRLEFNKKTADASATSASTSRFDQLILNGSVSVPTNSFCPDEYINEKVETIKIVNSPIEEVGDELLEEFETIDLAAISRVISSENRCDDNLPSANDQRKRRFVLVVVVSSVIGVTVVIIVTVLLTFNLHR